ncbi:MAG: LAGLIDADG family homing endonuclease [Minisyncoccota bacterium]
MPNKSKVIGKIKVPSKYFFDFLRGVFDGDGSVYSYRDKRWPSSHMYYVSFASASPDFLAWIQRELQSCLYVTGHITSARGHSTKQLKYGKREGLVILRRMYRNAPQGAYLSRKHLKITKMLAIVGQQLYLPGC